MRVATTARARVSAGPPPGRGCARTTSATRGRVGRRAGGTGRPVRRGTGRPARGGGGSAGNPTRSGIALLGLAVLAPVLFANQCIHRGPPGATGPPGAARGLPRFGPRPARPRPAAAAATVAGGGVGRRGMKNIVSLRVRGRWEWGWGGRELVARKHVARLGESDNAGKRGRAS